MGLHLKPVASFRGLLGGPPNFLGTSKGSSVVLELPTRFAASVVLELPTRFAALGPCSCYVQLTRFPVSEACDTLML